MHSERKDKRGNEAYHALTWLVLKMWSHVQLWHWHSSFLFPMLVFCASVGKQCEQIRHCRKQGFLSVTYYIKYFLSFLLTLRKPSSREKLRWQPLPFQQTGLTGLIQTDITCIWGPFQSSIVHRFYSGNYGWKLWGEKENDKVVFATTVSTITPHGNTKGRKVVSFLLSIYVTQGVFWAEPKWPKPNTNLLHASYKIHADSIKRPLHYLWNC